MSGRFVGEVARAAELSDDDIKAWVAVMDEHEHLRSPFFHPRYHQVLDSLGDVPGRGPAFVVVHADADGAPGYWPYQREARRRAGPSGGRLTDYQGVVAARPRPMPELLRTARVDEYRFDHVPLAQTWAEPWTHRVEPSPRIDGRLGAPPHGQFSSTLNRTWRQLERRGALVAHLDLSSDRATRERAVRSLIRWKSAQYVRTGKDDVLRERGVTAFLESLIRCSDDSFGARVSALTLDERPIAVHLGLYAAGVWHYWLPAYDPEYARLSPGMLLLRSMVDQAGQLGTPVIDLGRGREPYKIELANGSIAVGVGLAHRPTPTLGLVRLARRVRRRARPMIG